MLTKIDHFSVSVTDLMAAETFYADILGQEIFGRGRVESRKYCTTDDLELAASYRDGHFDPPQSRIEVGPNTVALFLRHRNVPQPPPEQVRGTPRVALTVTAEQMEKAVRAFERWRVRFEGPVQHRPDSPIDTSLYLRDPCGNFFELCCPREAPAS